MFRPMRSACIYNPAFAAIGVVRLVAVATLLWTAMVPGHDAYAGIYAQRNYTNTPLMVIRFNQPRIYYQQQLFTALKKAVEVKPTVQFRLVAFAPVHSDKRIQRRLGAQVRARLSQVVGSMQQMGIPANRITVNHSNSDKLQHDELHLYVY